MCRPYFGWTQGLQLTPAFLKKHVTAPSFHIGGRTKCLFYTEEELDFSMNVKYDRLAITIKEIHKTPEDTVMNEENKGHFESIPVCSLWLSFSSSKMDYIILIGIMGLHFTHHNS